jgi:hypothetical protein
MRCAACCLALAALACKAPTGDPPDALASPQANAEPAPLANVPALAASGSPAAGASDAGPPPLPMRSDTEAPPDNVPRDPSKETLREGGRDSRELYGYTLEVQVHPSDVPGAFKGAEVSQAAIEVARKKTDERLTIDLNSLHARIVFEGGVLPLPSGTEVRARADRYGHVLLWPGENTYRVVAPGALRALVGERRLDVGPLSAVDVVPEGEGPVRLNARTRKVSVTTRAAKSTFEIAQLKDAGEGGALVCRALLDLVSAAPSTPLCGTDEVPLRAELRWTTSGEGARAPEASGSLTFEVVDVTRRLDLSPSQLAAPPAGFGFVSAPLPSPPSSVLLSRVELAAFRTAPVDVPAATAPGDAQAPKLESGLALFNATDELRFVWLDGVPVAWLAPGAREHLPSLVRGRYIVEWRTALGDAIDAPQTVVVPGASATGATDGGVL